MREVEVGVEECSVDRWLSAADIRISPKGAMKSMFQDIRRILFGVGTEVGDDRVVGIGVDEDAIQ